MKKILIGLFLVVMVLLYLFAFGKEQFTDHIDSIEVEHIENSIGASSRYVYPFKNIDQFKPSSCSIQAINPVGNKHYIMNIRYINYSFNENGAIYYHPPDTVGKTKNVSVFLDGSYKPVGDLIVMKENYTAHPCEFTGLEDIRLFYYQNKLKCIASCGDITNDTNIVITIGDYDIKNKLISNLKVINSSAPIEKNWIFVDNQFVRNLKFNNYMNFIYEWSPLKIGYIRENKLEIYKEYKVPQIFKRFRGSTIVIEYNGYLWCLVHYLKNPSPRVYYHCIVQFENGTLKPIAISNPFVFLNKGIEYCIGFEIKNDTATFIFSTNDSTPSLLQKDINTFIFNTV